MIMVVQLFDGGIKSLP